MGQMGGARPGSGRPRELDDRVRVTSYVERTEAEALERRAAKEGKSVASVIREAIQAYVAPRRRRR